MSKKKRKAGLIPGTITYTGKKGNIPIKVIYIEYDLDKIKNEVFEDSQKMVIHQSDEKIVQWYDIRGLHDEDLIKKMADVFSVHPLVSEDITDVYKRPEYVEYEAGHFISLKSFNYNKEKKEVTPQSISIYFGKGFVLSFQEHDDDVFSNIRARITDKKGRIRGRGADYLSYAIIDYIVDSYYLVLDEIEEELEMIENQINIDPDLVNKGDIYRNKINLIKIRKSMAPLREAISQFSKSESEIIDERTRTFLRDLYDHIIQVVDSLDTHRDMLSGLQDLYLSELSMKMNRVMQFLTIVTAIFVPITFLAGIYGMNFEYIPELKFKDGYFILLATMVAIVIMMMYIFKRKKWF